MQLVYYIHTYALFTFQGSQEDQQLAYEILCMVNTIYYYTLKIDFQQVITLIMMLITNNKAF